MFKQTVCLTLCVLLMVVIVKAEEKEKPVRCGCKITKEYKPICGADGLTYDNWRQLACKNKCEKTNIEEAYKGRCAGDTRDD